jgi:DNA-binding MarR family transcriptional regulator
MASASGGQGDTGQGDTGQGDTGRHDAAQGVGPDAPGTAAFDAELVSRLRVAVGRIARQLRQRNSVGLTGSQLSALVAVEARGSVRLGDLATMEGIAPSTLSRIVASLEDAGLTERVADPGDRRSAWISLTATGQRVLSELRAERTVLLARRVAALDASERAALHAALRALERLAGDVEGASTGEQPVGDQPVRDRHRVR